MSVKWIQEGKTSSEIADTHILCSFHHSLTQEPVGYAYDNILSAVNLGTVNMCFRITFNLFPTSVKLNAIIRLTSGGDLHFLATIAIFFCHLGQIDTCNSTTVYNYIAQVLSYYFVHIGRCRIIHWKFVSDMRCSFTPNGAWITQQDLIHFTRERTDMCHNYTCTTDVKVHRTMRRYYERYISSWEFRDVSDETFRIQNYHTFPYSNQYWSTDNA